MEDAPSRQLAANRANAQKSTGPRTADGRAVSRLNAVRHGLTAEQIVLTDESAGDFDAFRAALIDELDVGSALEAGLADDVAALMWRLKRCHRIEPALLRLRTAEHAVVEAEKAANRNYDRQSASGPSRTRNGYVASDPQVQQADAEAAEERAGLGQAFAVDAASDNALTKLSRYETTLWRNFERALHRLERAQSARRSAALPASVTVLPSRG